MQRSIGSWTVGIHRRGSASEEGRAWLCGGQPSQGSLSLGPSSHSLSRPTLLYSVCLGPLSPSLSPALTRAPLGSRCVSVLGEPGGLVVQDGAQIPVPPPALALLLFFILQSPLPGQAGGEGRGSEQPRPEPRIPGSPDPQSRARPLQGWGKRAGTV